MGRGSGEKLALNWREGHQRPCLSLQKKEKVRGDGRSAALERNFYSVVCGDPWGHVNTKPGWCATARVWKRVPSSQ